MQKTLENSLEVKGIGLHSGCESRLMIEPLEENRGIVFVRSDLPEEKPFPALYSDVADTRNCTCLGNGGNNCVSTIEHIMAALYAAGVDNALLKVSNPEVPIMDGSAKIFYEKLKTVPLAEQKEKRKYLRLKKEVSFSDKNGNFIKLKPADNLHISFEINFPSPVVGCQKFSADISENLFASEIAPARTFCERRQIEYLRSLGLIKGGSLDNAVVLDGDKILNEGGFRLQNECVKHKVLDCIGDMFTSGYRLLAGVEAYQTGHFHNNEVLKVLFSDTDNYELTEE